MYKIARTMQVASLMLLPLSMMLQIAHRLTVGQMLIVMVAGFCLFWIGRIVEGYYPQS
ncbi:MAG TPA: hypothetical protein VHC22_32765 [Pirellulales bacterium]|nr:hypothetical protein [Pirellulales bacterium]